MVLDWIQVGFLGVGPMKLQVRGSDPQNVFWPNKNDGNDNKETIYEVLIIVMRFNFHKTLQGKDYYFHFTNGWNRLGEVEQLS